MVRQENCGAASCARRRRGPSLGCRWLADAACRRRRCPDGCQRFERAPFGARPHWCTATVHTLSALLGVGFIDRRGATENQRLWFGLLLLCAPRFSGHKHASFGRGAVGGLCDERRENRNSCEGLFLRLISIFPLLRLPCGRRLAAAAPPPRPPPLPPIAQSAPSRVVLREKQNWLIHMLTATSACHCQSCRRIPYFPSARCMCAFVCVLATALCTRERPPPPPDAMV